MDHEHEPPEPSTEALRAAADRVIDRLLQLAAGLSPAERSVLAALLEPALRIADDDVIAFEDRWRPSLPESIDAAVRARGLHVFESD